MDGRAEMLVTPGFAWKLLRFSSFPARYIVQPFRYEQARNKSGNGCAGPECEGRARVCVCVASGLGNARSTWSMQAHSVSCVSVPRSSGVTEANGAAHSDVSTRNNIEPCQNRPRLSLHITARRTRDLRTLFRRTLALHIKALHTPGPRTLAPRTPAPLLLHASLFCIFSQEGFLSERISCD